MLQQMVEEYSALRNKNIKKAQEITREIELKEMIIDYLIKTLTKNGDQTTT